MEWSKGRYDSAASSAAAAAGPPSGPGGGVTGVVGVKGAPADVVATPPDGGVGARAATAAMLLNALMGML